MYQHSILTRRVPNWITKRLLNRNCAPISHILASNKSGDTVTVKGWIKSLRDQKANVFFDVSDGSGDKKLQIFIPKNSKPPGLNPGASVIASGTLNLSPKGQLELVAQNVEVCGTCVVSEGYPFAPRKQYSAEYIRQYLHLRPRTNKFGALLRVRSAATLAIHSYLNRAGFINVHTPILTSNDCEGAGEVFKALPDNPTLLKTMVKEGRGEDTAYFNQKAFLTVSGQLHLEAVTHGLSKVYTLGPTFRAENSRSRLHLSEFYMLEAEVAFVTDLRQIMDLIESLVKEVTRELLNNSIEDMGRCQDSSQDFDWLQERFPVLTYKEACQILEKHRDRFDPNEGLGKEEELFLVEHCGGVPTFITEWPTEMKPFYMKESGRGSVAAFDLLGPNVGEVVGGSLREDSHDRLKEKLGAGTALDWYLDLRKFGSVPTGGFGLGFERYLQMVLGIANIKDAIPFPRWPHNCAL